jgi:large subunit ribosomal protein L13
MTTKIFQTKNEDRKWYLVDVAGLNLGRISTVIADLLRGKNKATYTPNMDGGDNVIVINAAKVELSREVNKLQKTYYRHSGYPGGIRSETFAEAIEKHPERVIEHSIKGMLPKNKMAVHQLSRLKVYAGKEHPHTQDIINIEVK